MSYNLMLEKAIKLHNEGAFNEAQSIYLKILETAPEQSDVWNLLGLIAQSRGQLLQALNSFMNAIKYSPIPFAPHYFNLGLTYKGLNKPKEAEDAFMRAVKLNDDFKEAWNYLGLVLIINGNKNQAIKSFCKALEIDAEYKEARANLCFYTNDDAKLFELALDDYDFNANFLSAQRTDDFNKKEYYLRRAVFIDENHTEALLKLADVLNVNQKNDEALKIYYKVMNSDTDEVRAILGAADIYLMENHIDKAITLYEKSFDIRRDIGGAYLNYGIALYKQKRLNEALEAYRQAVILCPNDEKISYNLALILKEIGEYEEALGLLFNAYLKNKGNKLYQINIMETLENLYEHNAEMALKIAENWSKLDAENIFSNRIIKAFAGGQQNIDDKKYSQILFDNFALNYDEVMDKLDVKIIDCFLKEHGEVIGNVLDLGCGTGIGAERLKNEKNTFVGVDISENMLDIAQKKGVYDELILDDIEDFLLKNRGGRDFDLVISFDVLGYIGNVKKMFDALKGVEFWFSFEQADENRKNDYFLSARGRYQHKKSYIEKCLQHVGFKQISFFELVLRKENGQDVLGFLVKAK